MILLGHVSDFRDGKLSIAPDMKDSLAKVDQFETEAPKKIDDYITRLGLDAPPETVTQFRDGYIST